MPLFIQVQKQIWNTTLPKTTLIGLEGKENPYPQQQEDLHNNFLINFC
jgi:hypothetical protein